MFIDRVRDQLHVVLAMSPIGDALRTRLRMFPSLVNCCTIDWFQVKRMGGREGGVNVSPRQNVRGIYCQVETHPIFDK